MKIDETSKTVMSEFMQDLWRFVKAHWTADPDDDEYFLRLIDVVTQIGKKYGNHPAVVKTMCGYMDYLEHEGCGIERKHGEYVRTDDGIPAKADPERPAEENA